MPWPGTTPWTGKTATELREVIVALCNAVGDRYQCIGLDRPSWPVNTDQSIYSVTDGTKSATLIVDDLYGLDIFRYDWWGLVSTGISGLISPSTTASVRCRGFCTSSAGDGKTASRWTLSALETAVGRGTINATSVGGGQMHLFDEVAPMRFKEMLDLLIYPVVYLPRTANGSGELLSTTNVPADFHAHAEGTDNAGDVWGALIISSTATRSNLSAQILHGLSSPYYWSAQKGVTVVYEYDMDDTENGAGILGTILSQYYRVLWASTDLITADADVNGSIVGMSGTEAGAVEVLTDMDPWSLSGIHEVTYSWDSLDAVASPFDGSDVIGANHFYDTGSLRIGPYDDLFTYNEDDHRLVLDISANCSDQ